MRYPDVEGPLGTYDGWSLRKAGYAEGDRFWNTGSFVPFARTRAERLNTGDPRPSIEERNPLDPSESLGPLIRVLVGPGG